MGIRLVEEVLDHAPADLTAAERLVLVVLAGYARDETREAWPGRVALMRRTGLSARGLRHALTRLAKRGYRLRVAAGELGTDGRPTYAFSGRQTGFRLPLFAPDTPNAGTVGPPFTQERGPAASAMGDAYVPEGGPATPPSTGHWGTGASAMGDAYVPEGGPARPPFSSSLSDPSSRRARTRAEQLVADAGARDDDEIAAVIEKIRVEHRARNVDAYVTTLAGNGDLGAIVWQVQSTAQLHAASGEWRTIRGAPECPHGQPGGDLPHPRTGEPVCPQCRLAARSHIGRHRGRPGPA